MNIKIIARTAEEFNELQAKVNKLPKSVKECIESVEGGLTTVFELKPQYKPVYDLSLLFPLQSIQHSKNTVLFNCSGYMFRLRAEGAIVPAFNVNFIEIEPDDIKLSM